ARRTSWRRSRGSLALVALELPWAACTRRSYPRTSRAGVAELADAPGLGPGGLAPLEVRVLSPASRLASLTGDPSRAAEPRSGAASRRCAPSCRWAVRLEHCPSGIRARSDASGNREGRHLGEARRAFPGRWAWAGGARLREAPRAVSAPSCERSVRFCTVPLAYGHAATRQETE